MNKRKTSSHIKRTLLDEVSPNKSHFQSKFSFDWNIHSVLRQNELPQQLNHYLEQYLEKNNIYVSSKLF